MSYTALTGDQTSATTRAYQDGDRFGYQDAEIIRQQLLGLGSGVYLGPLNTSRGYRALSTSYVLPDDYGRVRIDWDRLGSGWSVFALYEVITDNASGTVRVEIVDLSGPTQVVEQAATANPTTWTVQPTLAIPQLTGVKYYAPRIKGGDAAIGVGMVGGIYLAAP